MHHHYHVNINGVPGTTAASAYLQQNGNPTINEHFPSCVITTYSHSTAHTTTVNNVVVRRYNDVPGCSKSTDNNNKIERISEERSDFFYSENYSTDRNGWPSIISVLDTPERKRLKKNRSNNQGSIDENSFNTWTLGSPAFSQTPEIIGSPPVMKTPKTMLSNVTNIAPNVHISPMGSFSYRSCLKGTSPRSSFSKQFYGFSFSGSNLGSRSNEIQQQNHNLNVFSPLQQSARVDLLKPVSRVLELASFSTSTPSNPSNSHNHIDILSSLVKSGGKIDSFHHTDTANNSSYDSGCFVTSSSLADNTSLPSSSGTKNCVETPSKGLNVSLSIDHEEVDSCEMNVNRFLHSTPLGNHIDAEYLFTPKNFGLDDSSLDLDGDSLSLTNPFVDDVISRMMRHPSPDLPMLQIPLSSQGKRTNTTNNSIMKRRQRLKNEVFGILDRREAIGETEDQLSITRMAKAFRRRHKLKNRPAFALTNLRTISAGLPSDALADGVIIHL